MRFRTIGVLMVSVLIPLSAWAGMERVAPAPTLGEGGLVALAVGLVGAGVAFLRNR